MQDLLAWIRGNADLDRWLSIGLLVAARVAPLTLFAPWLSLRAMAPMIRTGLLLALTVALAPLAEASSPELTISAPWMAAALAREVLIGTVFAVAVGLPLQALEWSGRLVDTWRGAGLADVIAPPSGERTSPLGDFQLLLGISLFVSLGGHRVAMDAFAMTFRDLPLGALGLGSLNLASLALGAARLFADALALAVAFAAPAAAAIVLSEVALGLISRVAPQVPVFFAGMPLRAAAGLAGVLLGLSVVLEVLPGAFREALSRASQLL